MEIRGGKIGGAVAQGGQYVNAKIILPLFRIQGINLPK